MTKINTLDNSQLITKLKALVVDERKNIAAQIALLKEVKQTRAEIKAFLPGKAKREAEAFVSNLNKDGSRSKKPQTVRRNKPELTEAEVLDAALELLIEKRDPVRKAARAKARQLKNASQSTPENSKTVPGQEQEITAPKQAPVLIERYIPARTRHELYSQAGKRCTYVGSNGRRCDATTGLHIDHRKPFSQGGNHALANLRLMCPAHNGLIAERNTG